MKKLISVPLAVALLAPALTAPYATADDPETCANPGYAVTSGTLKWGVKQTFRNYIKGPIARGTWKTENVQSLGDDPVATGFNFGFEVDPEASLIFTDDSDRITNAVVETKDSGIGFTGHHGALATNLLSPYVRVNGANTEVGSTYVGYYVPGQTMPNYKPSDHTPANRTEGNDTFAEGDLEAQKITKDADSDTYTIEFSSSKLHYVPKPGTKVEQRNGSSYQLIEGVDVLFLGFYEEGAEFDDYTVTLKATKTCMDKEVKYKKGLENKTFPAKKKIDRGEPSELSPGLKAVSAKIAFTEEETGSEPTTPSKPHEPGHNTSSDTDFGEIHDGWSIFLAVLGAISMFAILSKLFVDIIKPFLPKF